MSKWREEPPGSGRWRKNLYVNGKPHKLTAHGNKRDAETFEARKRIELGAIPRIHAGTALAFDRFCVEHYAPMAMTRLRSSTWSIRRYHLDHLIDYFGRTPLTRLNGAQIEGFKIKRLAGGTAPVTINTELGVLIAILSYARDRLGLPCASVAVTRLRASKRRKGKIPFYTRTEVELILAAAAESLFAPSRKEPRAPLLVPLFTFLFETGCRKSEVIALKWPNVRFEERLIRIWSESDDMAEQDYEVKSREREIPMSDHLYALLAESKRRQLSAEWVFPCMTDRTATKGQRYAEFPDHTWHRVLRRATELAREIDPLARAITGGPHTARHTFASFFLKAKPDLFLLGRIMGHGTAHVTELYAHLLPEHLAEGRNVVTFEPAARRESNAIETCAPAS